MLNIDKFFYKALTQSAEVTGAVSDRIYNPARTIEQEEADVVPYLIITYDQGSSVAGSKDSILQPLDAATVSVLVVADSRDSLADLTELVQDAVSAAFEDDEFYDDDWLYYIDDCTESASAVQYDPMKPCCYQTLTFACSTSIL